MEYEDKGSTKWSQEANPEGFKREKGEGKCEVGERHLIFGAHNESNSSLLGCIYVLFIFTTEVITVQGILTNLPRFLNIFW